MNRPYFASRNHSSRFSRAASGGRGAGVCAVRVSATRDRRLTMRTLSLPLGCSERLVIFFYFALGPHPQRLPPLAIGSRRFIATPFRSVKNANTQPPTRQPPAANRQSPTANRQSLQH